ncbi:aminotransferase class I/II-fold pyridoxal phosphate-dependent enzyme [Thermoactinomyces mirandus]|uniref:Aminotransferase class V-fold PLP-dependent enzyme n=1 Tax=Thermoactinomyces mirandus TaxID=2756294 RepID=A0A7W1XVA7_9BACL|nr:aminotransferase class V-fold PLP-dependent enzyme [Thermoactinomyces mirandus]MBA4603900.1 aminotransferase class V-fold PLP-dependent enzyme [Thermoactinomyces mirandus]
MDQTKAPLFESLKAYVMQKPANFHVPGHKQGQAFDREALDWFDSVLKIDLTEVGQLDDLHQPTGVIKEAEQLAAEAFRADATYFLVGGTTAGNLAAILSCCQPGDFVIVQRSSHQSVFHGCMLSRVKPIYLHAEWDEMGMEKSVSPAEIERILKENHTVSAVILTSPSYYGQIQPIREIAKICHRYQVPFIVDEAHGAHLGFHPDLPPSAMDLGADIAIQSTHKMLPSMTMSSMLHLQGTLVDREKIGYWLRVIESSSPSYPLMASLDVTRRFMAVEGEKQLERLLQDLKYFRGNIHSLNHLFEVDMDDPLKCILSAGRKLTGFQLVDQLGQEGIQIEMADPLKALLVFGLGTQKKDLDVLCLALQKIDRKLETIPEQEDHSSFSFVSRTAQVNKTLDQLRHEPSALVPLNEAEGKTSVDMIVPYPPGIPLVLPGEVWTSEEIEIVEQVLKGGRNVRGVHHRFNPMVNVLT